MEPGVIAIATIMAVGGFIAALALVTHVLEWRITARIAKTKQEKADLEKAAQSASDCKSPVRSTAPTSSKKNVSNVQCEKEKSQSVVVSSGYAPLKSPTSPMCSKTPASASFGEILIITSPKMPTAPELVHSPISTCSMPSPVTPYTPLTPYITSPTVATRPLLSAGSSFSQPQTIKPAHYAKHDPYTHLAPRVMGSRIHRYASPPRHLRVTIPDRNARPFERSPRRLPSDIVITAPPRVLARSISELVGDDTHDNDPADSCSSPPSMQAIREVRATEDNVREVENFGW